VFEDLVLDRRLKKMKVKSLRKGSLLLHEVTNVIAPSMLARPLEFGVLYKMVCSFLPLCSEECGSSEQNQANILLRS